MEGKSGSLLRRMIEELRRGTYPPRRYLRPRTGEKESRTAGEWKTEE